VAGELRRSCPRSTRGRIASWAMNFGNVFLPLTLFAAAAYRPFKYFMTAPAVAVFLALALTAYGAYCSRVYREGEWPSHDKAS
jgi:hypothetical protein